MVSIERQAELDRLRDQIDQLDEEFADFKDHAGEVLSKLTEIYELLDEAQNASMED